MSDTPYTRLAQSQLDLKAAQRLRYKVFVEELGADGPMVDHVNRFEQDQFDPVFDHLLLIDPTRDPETLDHVVGVYRLMRDDQAAQLGRFYSEDEYDLSVLKNGGRRLLELGRSCLSPEHRGGNAMYLMWNALAAYVEQHQIEVLFGVASFHGTDVQALAEPLSLLHHRHLAPQDLRVRSLPQVFQPMDLLAEERIDRVAAMVGTPALIKAYLRLGGFVGEGACIDHEFNTIDVCLVMDTQRLNARQRAIYTREASA